MGVRAGMTRLLVLARTIGIFVVTMGLLLPTALGAADCCDPDSPFREGEEWSDKPASCETLGHWADRAPTTTARISLAIKGKLTKVKKTDVVTYLEMCDAKTMQVTCVTYDPEGMKAGDTVVFGGGYERVGPKHIVMDPCLANEQ
jgi:hypothetical protein